MTDPTTSVVAGTTITIAGIATGIPPDVVMPAFCGALWALRAVQEGSIFARVAQVIAGTLFSAWATPAVVLMAASAVPGASVMDAQVMRLPIAWLVGWGGLRLLLPRVERWIRGQES